MNVVYKTKKGRSHTRHHFTQSRGKLFCQLKLEIKRNSHILFICYFISNFNFSYYSRFPHVSQSNSPYYLWSKNDTKMLFMNVALLVQNLAEEVNRAAGTKGIPGLVIQIYQTTLKINGMKGIKHIAVFSYLGMKNVTLLLYSVIFFHLKTRKVVTLVVTKSEQQLIYLSRRKCYEKTLIIANN